MNGERVKSVLLVVLVAASLVLSAGLWLDNPIRPVVRGASGYLAEGSGPAPELAGLLAPRSLVVHQEGRHFLIDDPTSRAYRDLWSVMREVLSLEVTDVLQDAGADSQELAALRREGTGIEALLPVELSYQEWLSVWGARVKGRSRAVSSPVQRFVLFPRAEGQVTVFLGGSRGRVRAVVVGGGDQLSRALEQADISRWPAREASDRFAILRFPSAFYVPANPLDLRSYEVLGENLDRERLAATFFADLGVIPRTFTRQGSVFYTDGQQGLLVTPSGEVDYRRPPVASPRQRVSILEGIRHANDFVSLHGGWPPGTRLAAARKATPQAAPPEGRMEPGYRFQYTYPLGPYPVAGGLEVVISSDGTVSGYSRIVKDPGRQGSRQALMGAEEALAVLDAAVLEIFGPERRELRVLDIYPGYVLTRSGRVTLRPVWFVEVEGSARVAVDPLNGRVYADGDAGVGG